MSIAQVRKELPTRTLTFVWVELQLKENALDRKIASILKRTNTEDYEELHETTCLWLAEWAARGTFDTYLKDGKPPGPKLLAQWVNQKIHHDRYKKGTDALARHMTGARTQCEVRHNRDAKEAAERTGAKLKVVLMPGSEKLDSTAPTLVYTTNVDGPPPYEGMFDLVDPNSVENLTSGFERDAEKGLVHDIIKVRRPRAAERYARIFDHLTAGTSKEEVAKIEGTSVLRVSHLFQRVRDDLSSAPVLVDIALRVLALACEDPWSSRSDFQEALPPEGVDELGDAISLLELRGLISEKNSTYIATDAGHSARALGTLA